MDERKRKVTRWGALGVAAALVAAGTAIGALAATGTFNGNSNLPPEKQAVAQRIAAQQAAARALHVAKPAPARGAPARIPARVGGLIKDLRQGPFSPAQFQSNSTWQGPVAGTWIQVYAGADVTGSAPVGELRLYSMPIDPNDGPNVQNAVGAIAAPKSEASLSLESVTGLVLTVSAPSGDRFTFNVATRKWGTP
jgi:hypothetical protein